MNTLVAPAKVSANFPPLEQLLDKLKVYGLPTVCMPSAEGWYCHVEMNTNTTGTDFKVRSEFKHASATAAAHQCLERIVAALQKLEVRS